MDSAGHDNTVPISKEVRQQGDDSRADKYFNPDHMVGMVLNGRFRLEKLLQNENHYQSFSVRLLDGSGPGPKGAEHHEARVYDLRDLSSKCRKYRVRSMKRLSARLVMKTELHGKEVIVFRTGVLKGELAEIGTEPDLMRLARQEPPQQTTREYSTHKQRESERIRQRARRDAKRRRKRAEENNTQDPQSAINELAVSLEILCFATKDEESLGKLADIPEDIPHWSTVWSASDLTFEEKDVFEDLVADLFDWVEFRQDSCEMAVKRHSAYLPAAVKRDRSRNYYSAIIRYILVELVMCCKDDENGSVNDKMKKLISFMTYLVSDINVISVKLVDEEFENVLQDTTACPGVGLDDIDKVPSNPSMFENFHDFACRLYRRQLLTSLRPAIRALDHYFHDHLDSQSLFYTVTKWLTYAHADLFSLSPIVQNNWPFWYTNICERMVEYSKGNPVKAERLKISVLVALKRMKSTDARLQEFDTSIWTE